MPANRSPNKARRGKAKAAKPLFNLDLGLELELETGNRNSPPVPL